MKERILSTIVFYDKNKRILLQNREEISKFGEQWGVFGGSIEPGETPEQALVREIKEELSYTLRDFKLFKVYEFNGLPGIQDIHIIEHLFIAPFPGLKYFNQKEGNGMSLFAIEDAIKLKILPAYLKIFNDLKKYFSTSLSF